MSVAAPITISLQEDEYQYKKTLGVSYQQPGVQPNQELISSLPYIINSQIMANNIPTTAPSTTGTFTTLVGGGTKYTTTDPNIFFYEYIPLTQTYNANNLAWYYSSVQSSNITTHSIPSTYGTGYTLKVFSSANSSSQISSSSPNLPWIFDYATGILTFTGTTTYTTVFGAGFSPYISFWRYEGQFGLLSNATTIDITNNSSSVSTFYPTFVSNFGVSQTLLADTSSFNYVPSTSTLTATTFNGTLSGNA